MRENFRADPLFKLLAETEIAFHELGWTSPHLPMLLSVVKDPHSGDLALSDISPKFPPIGGTADMFVHFLGNEMITKEASNADLAKNLAAEGMLYALIFAFEAFIRTPGMQGQEVRVLQCVDIRGYVTSLERLRETGVLTVLTEPDPHSCGGSLEGMRLMLIAAARHFNSPELDLDALMNLKMISDEARDMVDQINLEEMMRRPSTS